MNSFGQYWNISINITVLLCCSSLLRDAWIWNLAALLLLSCNMIFTAGAKKSNQNHFIDI